MDVDTNGEMTLIVGLPACRALIAFGQGQCQTANALLSALPPVAHHLGGSQKQRHVLTLTRDVALQRLQPRRHYLPSLEAITI
jgi:hypothetical protein